jgi:hypothetical protein
MRYLKKIFIYTFITFSILTPELFAFSNRGPFIHATITLDALLRIFKKKPYEFNFICSSTVGYMSNENDYNLSLAQDSSYHCDSNNLIGCSYRLNQLVEKASHTPDNLLALRYLGMALHIVQDFYAHSNWVEIFGFSFILADIENFQIVPPPPMIQTGLFPDVFAENVQAQIECYFKDKDAIKGFILGATHDCLNKDSNYTKRGTLLAENSRMTLHELAAEYATRSSVKIIEKVIKRNPFLSTCMVPKISGFSCNTILAKGFMYQQRED